MSLFRSPCVLSDVIMSKFDGAPEALSKDIAAFLFARVYTSGTAGFSSENARYGSRFLDHSHPIEWGRSQFEVSALPEGLFAGLVSRRLRML